MVTNEFDQIVVVGAGYVGLVTAVGFGCIADVCLVDKDDGRRQDLINGTLPIYEPDLEGRFQQVRPNLRFFSSLTEALSAQSTVGRSLVFVAVGTPTLGTKDNDDPGSQPQNTGHAPDLDAVDSVIDELIGVRDVAVVMKSTVPPGTARRMQERAHKRGHELAYVSCPEFLQEGEALNGFDEPDRIVIGCDDIDSEAARAVSELHIRACEQRGGDSSKLRIERMDATSAETVKYAANLHLAMRVSYANQIANFCEAVDADARVVLPAVGADHRIGEEFLMPGLGFGGSCFRKDVLAFKAVSNEHRETLDLADATLAINDRQIDRVVDKLDLALSGLIGKRVAILGLAFKPDTDDVRNSPSFELAHRLRDREAVIRAWDPEPKTLKHARDNYEKLLATRDRSQQAPAPRANRTAVVENEWMAPDELASDAIDALRGSDAVVIATAWPALRGLDWTAAAGVMNGDLVIDGRNHLNYDEVTKAGLRYLGTGYGQRSTVDPVAHQ